MGPAGRAARVGKATRAAGGMQVNRGRPGAWPSSVSSRSRPALAQRGLRLPLLKNPEDLTAGQAASLGALRSSGAALWRGYLLKEALRAVFHGDPAGRPRRTRPLARLGVPQPHPPVRRALAEGQAQARGDPAFHRARRLQRPRRGREQQDRGGDTPGIRLQEHRQPHSARHAEVLGPQAVPAGQGGGVTPTHTNSRSLIFCLHLFVQCRQKRQCHTGRYLSQTVSKGRNSFMQERPCASLQ